MQNNKKLEVVSINNIFFKRMSFWIYLFVIANIVMFFAFTQDFYFQRFYANAQVNFKQNSEVLRKEVNSIASQVNQLEKKLNVANEDECDDINNLKEVNNLPTPNIIQVDKIKSTIKIKSIYSSLQNYYNYLEQSNNEISLISNYNTDLNTIIPNAQKLTNICINYDRLMTISSYSKADDFLIKRLIEQVNELNISKLNSNTYFSNISKTISEFNTKNYSVEQSFGSSLTFEEKQDNKKEFSKLIKELIKNVQDYPTLIDSYQKIILTNEDQLATLKNDLVSSATSASNQNLLDNILKISF